MTTRATNGLMIALACVGSVAAILWLQLRPVLISESVGVTSAWGFAAVLAGLSSWRLLPYLLCLWIAFRTQHQGAVFVSIAAIAITDAAFYWIAITRTGQSEAQGWALILLPLWHIGIYIAAWWTAFLLVRSLLRAKS
ncbi:MAG: hypothetical protein C0631_13005 [Sedimenticola sp.]|jgi:hypothetical protein|nr:MAG: hypothetical protein C0631_13005 [Sedimenticola sp.]